LKLNLSFGRKRQFKLLQEKVNSGDETFFSTVVSRIIQTQRCKSEEPISSRGVLGIQDGAFSADLISGGELLAYIPNFCLASGAPTCVP
jgi:hypothetical protein